MVQKYKERENENNSLFCNSEGVVNDSLHNTDNFVFPIFDRSHPHRFHLWMTHIQYFPNPFIQRHNTQNLRFCCLIEADPVIKKNWSRPKTTKEIYIKKPPPQNSLSFPFSQNSLSFPFSLTLFFSQKREKERRRELGEKKKGFQRTKQPSFSLLLKGGSFLSLAVFYFLGFVGNKY